MLIENDTIYEKRKSNAKNVDQIIKKSEENNLENLDFKYFDDTICKKKINNSFLSNDLDKSNEKEDSTSKDSKELNNLNIANEENFSISYQMSFKILAKEKKTFKNLKIEEKISEKIIKKKKYNKVQKQIKFTIYPNKEEEIYDESQKYDFLKTIKPKGLRNLGGCCYMNATLQCFYHIKELTYYFLDNKKEIIRKQGVLSQGYLDTVEGLSEMNKETYYVPQKFKNSLIEIDDTFMGSEGKDSGDLIELFLYNCQEELGGSPNFPDLSIDKREERLIYLDLYYKNSEIRSIISDLFSFSINATSKCFQCGVSFFNISMENSFLFSLEGVYNFFEEYKKKKNINFSNKRRVSVEECLTHFVLDGALRENTVCQYCKKNTSIFTTRSFLTLPKILIMIMSRGEREKFECDVDFEEELDLKDLYTGMKGIDRENSTKYTLLAGTILYGSNGWGHTVAFARHFDGQYYIFNDSSTRRTNFEEIKKSKIYLLFYQKLN